MKNAFKDNLWRKIWIGNEFFDSSYCETCYMEAEEWAKKDHPRLKGDKLLFALQVHCDYLAKVSQHYSPVQDARQCLRLTLTPLKKPRCGSCQLQEQ